MSAVLERIQSRLTTLYDIEVMDVGPFLCDEAEARAAVGEAISRGEVLLVAEDPDGVSIGLYVAPRAIELLEQGDLHSELDAYSLAAEGVSHFVYLVFRVSNDESVTQLELELQAEVDKYATALLEGWGVGAIRERSRVLRRRFFANVEYLDDEGTIEGDRYRVASRAAARYTEHLERRYVARQDLSGLIAELRRFYRLGQRDKLAHANKKRA